VAAEQMPTTTQTPVKPAAQEATNDTELNADTEKEAEGILTFAHSPLMYQNDRAILSYING
jgi:hypothetical protein